MVKPYKEVTPGLVLPAVTSSGWMTYSVWALKRVLQNVLTMDGEMRTVEHLRQLKLYVLN